MSAAVNEGDGTDAVGLLKSDAFSDLRWSGRKAEVFLPFLRKRVTEGLRDASGAVRKFLPSRLPAHETVYAMTVHKSQGSEFDRVLFMLPDRDVPLLTRELIYTGITRAKNFVEIWGREEIFREAVSRRITRKSGLGELLWG